MSEAPLQGIVVVELTHWLQGPVAGMTLAELGAEVIKVEPPAGDPVRGLRVSFDVDTTMPNGMNISTSTVNRDKQSLTLDLKQPAGRALLHSLVAGADVFLTNLRTDALARFGAGFEALAAVRPGLVYAQGTGLGELGPWAGRPAQDTIGMAHAGFLHTLSHDGVNPSYIAGSLSDVISGTYLAMGVLAALRLRDETGEAQYVSASQLQAMLWTQMMNVAVAANLGVVPRPFDRQRQFSPLFNLYQASDGEWFTLNSLQPTRAWPIFCRVIDRAELIDDERFRSIRTRSENRTELIALLDGVFATRPRDEWLQILGDAGLWVGKVNRLNEIADDDQVLANGYLTKTDDGAIVPGAPFSLGVTSSPGPPAPAGSAVAPRVRRGAPPLGRDSEELLRERLGLSDEEIILLKADGVVW